MNLCILYLLLIQLVLIKAYKSEKSNYSFVNSDEYDLDIGFHEIDELSKQYYNYNKPILNLEELMRQPELPGISDENWPYPEDEDPFSIYKEDGCKKCACGTKSNRRIVNGKFAKRDEFPWQVLITNKRRFICGGSVINDHYVLTAGHCVHGYKKNNLELRFGAHRRTTHPAVYRKIDRIWLANGFNIKTVRNDAAIIKLISKLTITPNVRPICLPQSSSRYGGQNGIVTGWGAIRYGGPPSEILKKANVPVLTNQQCRKTGYRNRIKAIHICAGNKGEDSCSGDSGGPLIVHEGYKYNQIGIVSFGRGCNKPNFPSVYTRVTKFKRFIVKIASKDACWCNN